MKHRKQSCTVATGLMPVLDSGITRAGMKFQSERVILSQLKRIMLSYDTILLRWHEEYRCFSRCEHALHCALKLFVFAFNRRQLHKRNAPIYPAHIKDFIYP